VTSPDFADDLLEAAASAADSRSGFVAFLEALRRDLAVNTDAWENPDLPRFLEALAAATATIDQRNKNLGLDPPDLTWALVAELFMMARIHE
jgi:hypothetical protein